MTYGYFEIHSMIEGVKKVYAKDQYWQEKARQDLLTAIFPANDLTAKVERMEYEAWEADRKHRQTLPMRC